MSFGSLSAIEAPDDGVVIGRTHLPLGYEGDATFHIAQYGRKVGAVEKHVELFHEKHQPDSISVTPDGPGVTPFV